MIKVIHCIVNGKEEEIPIDIRESLADMLRHRLGLTSVKKGCEVGECGACTVLVDDKAIDSCIYLALWADGKKIITVEGLQQHTSLITAVEIVGNGKHYSRDELRKLISGHLCRCTGYHNILNAMERIVEEAHKFVGNEY